MDMAMKVNSVYIEASLMLTAGNMQVWSLVLRFCVYEQNTEVSPTPGE